MLNRTFLTITSGLLFLFVSYPASAQKTENNQAGGLGIFASKSEYNEFMGSVKMSAQDNPELESMIPLINDVVLGQPIGSTSKKYNTGNSTLGLLETPEVRKELEIVDSQYQDLQRVAADLQKQAANEIRSLNFSKVSNVSVRIRGIQKNLEQELEDLLLPHQSNRLRQLQMQTRLRRNSLARILTSDPLRTDLDIDEEQSAELLETEKELEIELQQEIQKLRQAKREKLLDRLKKSQRDQVKDLIGDAFEFQIKSGKDSKKTKTKNKN